MNQVLTILKKDPVINKLIQQHGTLSLDARSEDEEYLFVDLASSIAGQQLSAKAAATIWGRVCDLLSYDLTPIKFLSIADEELRSAGLSGAKIRYIKNLAEAVKGGGLLLGKLKEMHDEEVISQLTAVKGIGRWTAEMFLIFALARPDVFSYGDVGLKNAMCKLYGKDLSRAEQEKIAEKWKPYRSYASLYLWKSLDNTPKNKPTEEEQGL